MDNLAAAALIASLVPYLANAPVLIVLIAAAVVAVVRHQRHPAVSKLVLAFALIEIVLVVVTTWLSTNLPVLLVSRGHQPATIAYTFVVMGFVRSLISATALALVAWAALGWRSHPAATAHVGPR